MVNIHEPLFLRFCIQYASIALLYYDYTLTFAKEVKFIWAQRFSVSTALYFACRYAMVSNILYTLAIANKLPTMSICSVLSVVGRAAILIVWGARTCAIFNRNRIILILFLSLGTFIVVLAALYIPYIACNGSRGDPPASNNPLFSQERKPLTSKHLVTKYLNVFTVIYEFLSAGMTTMQSVQYLRVDGTWRIHQKGLIYLVLEQGLLYFVLVTSFSLAAVILQFKGQPGTFTQRLLNAITIPLAGMMTARFLLHLREWEYQSRKSTAHNSLFTLTEQDIPIQFKAPDDGTRWSAEGIGAPALCCHHNHILGYPPVSSSSAAITSTFAQSEETDKLDIKV